MRLEMSLSQEQISSDFKLDGKPPSGNDSSSGQFCKLKVTRDGSRVCICSGSAFKLLQLSTRNQVKLGAGSPSSGKDTKLEQLLISKLLRDARC